MGELEALGFTDVSWADVEKHAELANGASWAGRLPSDKALAEALGMLPYFTRVYRPASDAVHFGIGTMLTGFVTQPTSPSGEGASVALHVADRQSSEEVLALAVVTYGEFLQRAEVVVPHGVTDEAAAIIREWMDSNQT